MLRNYIKVAIRNIARNKLYAVINIVGLAMGLSLYLFGGLLSDYENSHDTFYENYERIYTVGASINPNANAGIVETNSVSPAVTPILKTELPELQAVARTLVREFLFSIEDNHYYQKLRFADPALLQIFDFDYISGDVSALNSPSGLLISESAATKYFGDQNPIGKTIKLNHKIDLIVSAVIKDLPPNTHFNTYFFDHVPPDVFAPLGAMQSITGFEPDLDWDDFNTVNKTYILLPEILDQEWLQERLDGIYLQHFNIELKKLVSGLFARPIVEANMSIWKMNDIPAIESIEILGLLVLIVACVNYTNLATAQSLKRSREVGLRKTLGAGPVQLLLQFIVESVTLTIFAMFVAISLLEFTIPLFNSITGKILTIDYMSTLPWLILTALIVGIISGSYPAYVIAKTNPIEALRTAGLKTPATSWIRSVMIGVQFTISVFMLAVVMVMLLQNNRLEENSNIFAKDQIYTLDGFDVSQIFERKQIIKNEILKLPGVENFTLSSQVPYEGMQTFFAASSTRTDFSSSFNINQMAIDQDFLKTYAIELIAGRILSQNNPMDIGGSDKRDFNVVINELAVQNLKFSSAQEAIGKVFYQNLGNDIVNSYKVVGVSENKNILGFHNEIKPFVMLVQPDGYRVASIKLSSSADPSIIRDIEVVWKRVIPDYPFRGRFLDERFQDMFRIFEIASTSLGVFAIFAFILALIGLFGLAAYMAEQRTKEIGIRKVHGATPPQVVNLLIWQFSKPVAWAMPFSVCLAYLASDQYLEFFDDRIGFPFGLIIGAAIIGLLLSWVTVATHAYNVARANPINALHYE
ncbi:MAG: FtsX-like permease family protein [Kordiimonadaceae bacterium]|nr:FtsX-like permease family protein [Kordiimonadaceae bacterium]